MEGEQYEQDGFKEFSSLRELANNRTNFIDEK